MAAGAADAAIARQNRVKKNCFTELFFARDYFLGYFLFAAEHHETTKNQLGYNFHIVDSIFLFASVIEIIFVKKAEL